MEGESEISIRNFINNSYVSTENCIESFNPTNGKVIAMVPNSGKKEVDMAVEAAAHAFKKWSATSVQERSRLMMKIADLIEERLEEFSVAESMDQGKTLSQSRDVEIPRAVAHFRLFGSYILHQTEVASQLTHVKVFNYTSRLPVGVAAIVCPWNFPLFLLTLRIAPCIAAGCTCVCKPSEFTSNTAFLFADCLLKSGLPAGVVNIVFGLGTTAGEELVTHPDVSLVSFTGGTVTGTRIRELTASAHKKLSLELGGKNAAIVFEDCDLDKYVKDIGGSCFRNSGQVCVCTSRIFVHESIFGEFLEKLKNYTQSLRIGDPLKATSNLGPVVSREHLNKIRSYIDLAVESKLKIICGETVDEKPKDLHPNGNFILPTIITGAADSSRLMQEEIFGPVVCVTPFNNENEVIERANNTKYGLTASVWTKDVGRAHRVASSLQVGLTWVNCFAVRDLHLPFGGQKHSGLDQESITDSIDFYSDIKTITVSYA